MRISGDPVVNKALEEMQAAEQTMLSMQEFNENYKDKTLEVDLDKILQNNPETFVIDGKYDGIWKLSTETLNV